MTISIPLCSHPYVFATLSSVVTYHVFHYFQPLPLCTTQMHTVQRHPLYMLSLFSHGHGYTCISLFSMHSGCFGKALPLLHLTTWCICFSIASWGRSKGSCWAGKWRAAVLTWLNGCSSRPWRGLQVSGAAQKVVAFSALGKGKIQLERNLQQKAFDG